MIGNRVRRATGADLPAVATALGGAFHDDPVLSFLLPHGIRNRQRRLRSFFALEAPRSLRHRGVWTSEDGGSAAIWYPPEQWREPTWTTFVHGPAQLRVFGRRLGLAGRVFVTMQQHHPQQPHWYLLYLGAAVTGEGRGSALLRAALAESDAARMPAYLEATSERNVALYRRHGFHDLDPLPLPGGGPPLFPMWRDPA